jgi:hypothetical protein
VERSLARAATGRRSIRRDRHRLVESCVAAWIGQVRRG